MQEFEWHLDMQQVKIYRCSTTCCVQINPIEFCYQDDTYVQCTMYSVMCICDIFLTKQGRQPWVADCIRRHFIDIFCEWL